MDASLTTRSLAAGARRGAGYRLVLPREAMRGAAGGRLGLLAGSSLDFHDYREYHPGDDLRHLDWGVYARTDREIVKLFREEVEPKLDIVLDASASMDLADTRKGEAALTLSATLAAAALNAACRPALWLAGADFTRVENAEGERPEGWRLSAFGRAATPCAAIAGGAARLRRNGIRVFVSDLLWPGEPEKTLACLADGAAALFVVQLLARDEETPPALGRYRLDDVETGEVRDVFLDAAAVDAYRATLAAHRERWNRACAGCGARWAALTDADVLTAARLDALERVGLLESPGGGATPKPIR